MNVLPIKFGPLPAFEGAGFASWALEIGSPGFAKLSLVYAYNRELRSVAAFSVHIDAHPYWWVAGAVITFLLWSFA